MQIDLNMLRQHTNYSLVYKNVLGKASNFYERHDSA